MDFSRPSNPTIDMDTIMVFVRAGYPRSMFPELSSIPPQRSDSPYDLQFSGSDFFDDSPFLPIEFYNYYNIPEDLQCASSSAAFLEDFTPPSADPAVTCASPADLFGSMFSPKLLIAPELHNEEDTRSYPPDSPDSALSPALLSTELPSGRSCISSQEEVDGEDDEGDGDYSDDDDDDEEEEEEYVPVAQQARKRRAGRQSDQSASPSSSVSLLAPSSRQRAGAASGSRNIQVSDSGLEVDFVRKSNLYACPVKQCTWVQHNHRMPDLRRHISTHTRHSKAPQWVCCGIRVGDGPRPSVTYIHEGREMHGGCRRTFARRDALKRHLLNLSCRCKYSKGMV